MKLFTYSKETKKWLEVEGFQSLEPNVVRVHSTRYPDQTFGVHLIREGLYAPEIIGQSYMTEAVMKEYLAYEKLKKLGLKCPRFVDSDFKSQVKREFGEIYENLSTILQP